MTLAEAETDFSIEDAQNRAFQGPLQLCRY